MTLFDKDLDLRGCTVRTLGSKEPLLIPENCYRYDAVDYVVYRINKDGVNIYQNYTDECGTHDNDIVEEIVL